jgi:hypothetical protein
MKLEVLGLFNGNYAIFELDEDCDPVEVSSAAELRDQLRNRRLTERQISEALADLKTPPRKITIMVNR